MKKNEESLQNYGDTIKINSKHIWIPEGKAREKWIESLFKEIIAGNFQNLDLDIQVYEASSHLNIQS